MDVLEQAKKWWKEVKKVDASEIGSLMHRVRKNLPREVIEQIYEPLSVANQRVVQANFERVRAMIGGARVSNVQLLEAVTVRSPIILADRHSCRFRKIICKLSKGRYPRYSWVNVMQVAEMALVENIRDFETDDFQVNSVIVDYSEITKEFILNMEKRFNDYVASGAVDE